MNLRPLPPNQNSKDLRCLGEIDAAICALDLAFTFLSDRSFDCLSASYKRLADDVLIVIAERRNRTA